MRIRRFLLSTLLQAATRAHGKAAQIPCPPAGAVYLRSLAAIDCHTANQAPTMVWQDRRAANGPRVLSASRASALGARQWERVRKSC